MNELNAIEDINEEIGNIVAVAESIGLAATEAMREAGGSDMNVIGFSLVARELQMFSRKIAEAMHSLSGLIHWQLEVNAGKHRQVRPAGQADVDEIEQLIVSQVCELQIGMMRAAKQCATGLLIARSGDLETGRDEATAAQMQQMTQSVGEVVGTIARRIKKLESRLAEAGLWKRQRLFANPPTINEYPISDATAALQDSCEAKSS